MLRTGQRSAMASTATDVLCGLEPSPSLDVQVTVSELSTLSLPLSQDAVHHLTQDVVGMRGALKHWLKKDSATVRDTSCS